MDDIFDEIYETEQLLPTLFVHGRCYIGVAFMDPMIQHYVLLNTIQATTFFKHTYHNIVGYLYIYSVMKQTSLLPRILQLIILSDGTYSVCDKTIWIRLIQRRWKCVIQQRHAIQYLCLHFPRQLGQLCILHIPQLRGLMINEVCIRIKSD